MTEIWHFAINQEEAEDPDSADDVTSHAEQAYRSTGGLNSASSILI